MSIIPTINDERGSYTRGSFAFVLCLTIITTSWQGAGSVYAWTNNEGLGVIETFVQDSKAAKKASEDDARAAEAAAAELSEGRKAIDRQAWQAAIDRFNRVVDDYPTFDNVDQAMYWLAYSLNRAGVYQEADAMVDRLLAEHAKSNWRKDAEALKLQLAAKLGDSRRIAKALRPLRGMRVVGPPTPIAPMAPMGPIVVGVPPVPPVPPRPPVGPVVAWAQGAPGADDWDFDFDYDFDFDFDFSGFGANWVGVEGQGEGTSDDQIKCIALQGLFESNPERAVAVAASMLKPDSKATPRVKQCAAMLLGQSDSPQARTVLVDLARNSTDPKLQKIAIVALAQNTPDAGYDDTTINLLVEIATTAKDEGVAKAAVYALSQDEKPKARAALLRIANSSAIPEVRKAAIFYIGQSSDASALDDLFKVYQTTQDSDLKKQIIHSISQNDSARKIEILRTIIRTTAEPQLRRAAIWGMSQSDCSQPNVVDTLVSVYGEAKEPEVKGQVVDALGQCDSSAAVQALINVAKQDPSVDLRKKAVFWIGQKKDPAAVKFLDDLLTQP